MRDRRRTSLVFALALLAGCANRLPQINAIDVTRIGDVEGEVKRQLSVYQSTVNERRSKAEPTEKFICGKGKVDFDITTVQLQLATTLENTTSGSLGLTIPVSAGSVGPSGAGSRDVTDAETLTFPIYPVHDPKFRVEPADAQKPAPISDVLLALRKALIQQAAAKRICVYDYDYTDPTHDAGGTYEMAFTAVNDLSGGVELKLAIVDFSATHDRKSTTGNTLTVTFHQVDLPDKPLAIENGVPVDNTGGGGVATPMLHP